MRSRPIPATHTIPIVFRPAWRKIPQLVGLGDQLRADFIRQAVRAAARKTDHVQWILRLSLVVGGAMAFVGLLLQFGLSADWNRWLALAMAFVLPVVGLRGLRNKAEQCLRSRIDDPTCSDCGYSLTGLTAPDSFLRCPECGSYQVIVPRHASVGEDVMETARPPRS